MVLRLAKTEKFDAVIALGAVIRGATAHFDYVAGEAAKGVAQASHATGVPVVFGVLTTDTIEQAVERAGTKAGNKGFDAALAAIEMVTLDAALLEGGPLGFPMGARTTAREAALQMLYAVEATGGGAEHAIGDFRRELPGDAEGRDYADQIVRGVSENPTHVDELIRTASKNWRVERMTRVDRNILRIGAWELEQSREVPRAVIIDEAVELAKRYGTEESSAFVNGVLDRIAEDCGRVDLDKPTLLTCER